MDHYRVLGLTYAADEQAIRTAYRALAKKYHPDVSTFPDAHARFVAITEAYEVLSDPVARERYDRTRQSPSPKRASPRSEARYAHETEARQRAARAKAEEYVRMRYEQFDTYAFDTVAGYVAPKILGCLGITVIGVVLMLALFMFFRWMHWSLAPVALLLLFGFLPGVVYASTRFDEWHNKRQVARRKRGGR